MTKVRRIVKASHGSHVVLELGFMCFWSIG